MDFNNKKVLILGFGREGKSTLRFLKKHFPEAKIGIADKNNKEADYYGDNYLKSIKSFDIIIRTPGISLKTLKPFLNKKQVVTSQTEIFLDKYRDQTIGVTGTKGKSTTSSFTHHVLKKEGYGAHLIGNIGKPALSYYDSIKKNDLVVYEMSAHQLDGLKVSPHIAVFLNIFSEHLDYYANLKEYFNAKKNVTKYQKKDDYFVTGIDKINTKAKKISIKAVKTDKIHPENLGAVVAIGKILGIAQKQIESALKTFKTLDSRMEFVGKHNGIYFYNDSLATIPEATVFAIDKMGKDLETLIAGGLDRGISYKKLSDKISKSSIKTLILFPNSGEKIYKGITKLPKCFFVDKMKEAVSIAKRETKKGKICLLSPASPSFNLFKDYKDRGDKFKKYVRNDS